MSSVTAGWGDAQIITGPLILVPRLQQNGPDGWHIAQGDEHRKDVVLVAQTRTSLTK